MQLYSYPIACSGPYGSHQMANQGAIKEPLMSHQGAIKDQSRIHQGAIKEPSRCNQRSRLEGIELGAVDSPSDALRTGRDGQMMCEDTHEQRAVECMPRLDEGGEALVCRRQRRNGYVFAAHLWGSEGAVVSVCMQRLVQRVRLRRAPANERAIRGPSDVVRHNQHAANERAIRRNQT